jgi:hypothetical protein
MDIISDFLLKVPGYVDLLIEWFLNLPMPLLRGEFFLLLLIIFFALIYYLFKSDKLFLYYGKRFILLFEL